VAVILNKSEGFFNGENTRDGSEGEGKPSV
jgi:hypothetical protein